MKDYREMYAENEDCYNSYLYYDEVIVPNLKLVKTYSYVKKNKKNTNSNFKDPKSQNDWGVMFHKNNGFVLINVCMFNESNAKVRFQYIIEEGCKFDDILDSNHLFLQDVKQLIMDAIHLNNSNTLDKIEPLFSSDRYFN